MKTSQPTLIAFPGEKRNAQIMKNLLKQNWFISEYEQGQEVFDIKKLNTRCISMRTPDAIRYLLQWKVSGVIGGMDAMTDTLLQSRMKLRRDSELSLDFASSIIWYDPLPSQKSLLLGVEEGVKETERSWLEIAWVFDTTLASTLRLLVRNKDEANLANIEILSRKWEILTSYPYLVRAILARATGSGKNVGSIQTVEWKTEALLASGFWRSAVDIVVSGETARLNNLTLGPTLFESYPAFIVREDMRDRDPKVRWIATALNELSNSLYYNSPEYRAKYPRG